MDEYRDFRVIERQQECPGVVTLRLRSETSTPMSFVPGQFVNVASPWGGTESKSYSIASSPGDGSLSLTIRAAGRTSNALCDLAEGSALRLAGAYGFFHPVDEMSPRVFIAGGIGIVPFMSILRASVDAHCPKTLLLCSSRTIADALFMQELDALAAALPLTVRHHLTREREGPFLATYGRIGIEVLAEALHVIPDAHFFLCGSIPFVRDMRRHLRDLSVPEDAIFTESFF